MNAGAIQLSFGALAASGALVLIAGIVSLALRLQLERRLALAAFRTVVQLLLVGYLLKYVFALNHPGALAPILAVMILAAAHSAVTRPSRTYPGATLNAFITLTLCGIATTFTVTQLIIQVSPWYKPQYVIPLLGMILGNGLTGISLALDHLLEQFQQHKGLIEMELAHGATRWEAARDPLRESVRRGMIPIINSMMVVGIVSLPGMMTGQILAGESPLDAVKYQIVVMFTIAAATSLGCIGIALFTYHALFNTKHQLQSHRIRPR